MPEFCLYLPSSGWVISVCFDVLRLKSQWYADNQVVLITFWKRLSQLKRPQMHLCLALEVSEPYVQRRGMECACKRSGLVWLSLEALGCRRKVVGSWLLGGLGGNARRAGWGWASPPCPLCWGLKPGVKTSSRWEGPPLPTRLWSWESSISVNYLFISCL